MRGPWYISAAAVRDYLWLMGRPDCTDGPAFDAAEAELIAIAEATVASGRTPATLQSGALRYRGPKPRRLMLIVARGEGDAAALTAVQAGLNDGRGVAPHRRGGTR